MPVSFSIGKVSTGIDRTLRDLATTTRMKDISSVRREGDRAKVNVAAPKPLFDPRQFQTPFGKAVFDGTPRCDTTGFVSKSPIKVQAGKPISRATQGGIQARMGGPAGRFEAVHKAKVPV